MSSQKSDGGGKDALADYMRALNKLNGPEQSSATTDAGNPAAAGAQPDGATEIASPSLDPNGDDAMGLYLQALNKAKEPVGKPAQEAQGSPNRQAVLNTARGTLKAEAIASHDGSTDDPDGQSGSFRRGLDRLQNRGCTPMVDPKKITPRRIPAVAEPLPEMPLTLEPEAPPRKVKSNASRKIKPKLNFKPKLGFKRKKAAPRGRDSAAPFKPSPISIKVGAFLMVLVVGLLLQGLIYHLAEMPYDLGDLGIGATVALPVMLILGLVHPETRSDWTALLASATAIAVTGGLGIALGVSLLHANAMAMHEAGYVMQLFVHLIILSVLWGPVFLTVAGLLNRMELLRLSEPMEF